MGFWNGGRSATRGNPSVDDFRDDCSQFAADYFREFEILQWKADHRSSSLCVWYISASADSKQNRKASRMQTFKTDADVYRFYESVKENPNSPRKDAELAVLDCIGAIAPSYANSEQLRRVYRVASEIESDSPFDVRPHGEARLRPDPHQTKSDGRAHVPGKPVFYCADEPETAVAEVRPWKRKFVSCGEFWIPREVSIVDFTEELDFNWLANQQVEYMKTGVRHDVEKANWGWIGRIFSCPVEGLGCRECNPGLTPEYLPTQLIAGVISRLGYDGFKFQSSIGNGTNYVLFDVALPVFSNSFRGFIKNISFDVEFC